MKRYYLYTLCLFLNIAAYPQLFQKKQWYSGGIINLKGDTVKGLISPTYLADMRNYVTFKDSIGKRVIYRPKLIKGFYYYQNSDTIIFESKMDLGDVFIKGQFLLVIFRKNISCYYTEEMETAGYISIRMPSFFIYKGDVRFGVFPISFKKNCKTIFSDDNELLDELDKGQYTFGDLPRLALKYDTYKASK
jgi:hypothetical protein